jgi:hypothetical protein
MPASRSTAVAESVGAQAALAIIEDTDPGEPSGGIPLKGRVSPIERPGLKQTSADRATSELRLTRRSTTTLSRPHTRGRHRSWPACPPGPRWAREAASRSPAAASNRVRYLMSDCEPVCVLWVGVGRVAGGSGPWSPAAPASSPTSV